MKVVRRARIQSRNEVEIEVACVGCLGVDEQSSTPDLFLDREKAFHDIREESGAKSPAFVFDVDTQTSKQRNGLWIATGTLS